MDAKKQYAFYFDATKCNGCKACHIACKDKTDAAEGVIPRRVYEYVGGAIFQDQNSTCASSIFGYYTSVGCNHCSEPVCVKACPTGAMHKNRDTGIVDIAEELCIGCESCAQACPYDAPQIDRQRRIMVKCDACQDRLKQGLAPSCVEACMMRALEFGTVEEILKMHPNAQVADVAPLPSKDITHPNLFISPAYGSKPSGSSQGQVENRFEV